ncbi:MAG: hypothetical protein ACRDT9_05255, partial [Agromyces sp.]
MTEDDFNDGIAARRGSGAGTSALDRARRSAASGAHSADDAAANPSVRVDLPPAPVHEMPDDEVAVAIDDVAVNPGSLVGGGTSTTSVEVITPALAGAGYRGASRREPSPYSALLASDAT